jgi:hypothetical protein
MIQIKYHTGNTGVNLFNSNQGKQDGHWYSQIKSVKKLLSLLKSL